MTLENISVAMCTYNGVAYIQQQLESILRQTVLPEQIVISDDGSTDGTIERIESFWERQLQQDDSLASIQMTIIRNKESLGVTKNFEQALKACVHPLIALCDQDDLWMPTKLEVLSQIFNQDDELLFVFTDSRLVDAEGLPLGNTSFDALGVSKSEKTAFEEGNGAKVLLKRNLATGATVMLRKSLVDIATPFPADWVHDEWLALISAFAGKIYMSEECLIDYRQHGNNQIGMKKPGLRHYIGRLIFSRTERNAKLFNRAEQMNKHSFFQDQNPEAHKAAIGKLAHEVARQGLPQARLKRIKPVIKEMRTGRYSDFGLGYQDIARDLIQPV